MSFGSPLNKMFSPTNNSTNNANISQPPQKSLSTQSVSNIVQLSINNQINNQQPTPLKPGMVSMGLMIESVALKAYTEIHRLVDMLPSKEDIDKKNYIAKYLGQTRNLLIRLQSLNKWYPSAAKVDKCDKISNLLDEQSSFLIKTAEELSIIAHEKLPLARLHNLLPMIAADILASKTYSRLPNMIRLPVLRSQVISKEDKSRMLLELDRVLRIRVSNTKLPYRMRHIDIGYGRVTFTVPHEFKVTCTLLSDHFEHPWHLLDVKFLIQGNNICRGRSLIHANQLRLLHDTLQIRLNSPQLDSRPSLFHLYDMLHSMALSMQLDVLHEQIISYMNHQHGLPIIELRYIRASKLSFSYWHRTDKYQHRPKHMIIIGIDEEDLRRPLKVKHQPILSPDYKYTEKMLCTGNLSIKNLIVETIMVRIFSTLKMVQRLLFPFISGNTLISSTNPILLVPILNIEGNNNNNLKIQINSSNGYVKTNFEITLDKMRGFSEDKINIILTTLDNDINDLLMKSYNTIDTIDIRTSTKRELLNHRRSISSSLNKLRVILTKYYCLSIMQKSGFSDLHLLLNKPPIFHEKTNEKSNCGILHTLLNQELKGECELIFIPINIEWDYYIVVACETKFRINPSYRVFGLSTAKVFTTSTNLSYTEKQWALRPVKLSVISPDVILKMNNINLENYTYSIGVKRPSMTCIDLLHKIQSKNLKLDDGNAVCTDLVCDAGPLEFDIRNLPAVIGYMKDNIIFKLLLHEIERRSFVFRSEVISDELLVHSCKITKFPFPRQCSSRASNLMNKMLAYCSVAYAAQPQDHDGTSRVKWEAQYFFTSPFVLFDKTFTKSKMYSKKVTLCSKKCTEENSTGIKEAIEMLISHWEEMCIFCECCLIPILDKEYSHKSDVKLTDFQYNQLNFTYGNDNQYKAVISFNLSTGFKVLTEMSDINSPKSYITNPHSLITKDLDNYLNSHRNINVITKVLLDTFEFLSIIYPFNNSTLMVMPDSGSTHLLRNYSLIVLDAYHVVLVFRERFALNIILNNETHTVLLSDAHNNFHACNMSINEMPQFNKFMESLEESFRINIEDEVWSGLFVDQLGILLGSHLDNKKFCSPLENYLLSSLQLGSRKEIFSPLPCCNEAHIIPGNELKLSLIGRKDDTVPLWRLCMNVESVKSEPPWLLDPEMLSMAKAVLETKIVVPKLPEIGINIFRKLFQLPSFNLQKNLLKILTKSQTTVEIDEGKKLVGSLDLDWFNIQEAISQPQEPSSILLRFILNLKKYETQKGVLLEKSSSNLSLVVHYAAKSNQISILEGTCLQVLRLNLDKEANEMVVGKINGDTPLIIFVDKLMVSIREFVNSDIV